MTRDGRIGVSISVFCTIGGSEDGPFVNTTVALSIDGTNIGCLVDIVDIVPPPLQGVTSPSSALPPFHHPSPAITPLALPSLLTPLIMRIPIFFIDCSIYDAMINSTLPTTNAKMSWVFLDDTSSYLHPTDDWSRTSALPNFPPPGSDMAINSNETSQVRRVGFLVLP